MKRPAFMFYPADWLNDPALKLCSIGARGLWHELLCIMHGLTPYGHLSVSDRNAARLATVSQKEYARYTKELEENGVLSRTSDGVIFSRRMVKDEQIREVRAKAGYLGGNPLLKPKDKQQDNLAHVNELKQAVKQKPTPSFAVASALAVSSSLSQSAVDVRPQVDAHEPASGQELLIKTSKAITTEPTARLTQAQQAEIGRKSATAEDPIAEAKRLAAEMLEATTAPRKRSTPAPKAQPPATSANAPAPPGAARMAMLNAGPTNGRTKAPPDWAMSEDGISLKAAELHIERLPNETFRALKQRCLEAAK